MLVKVRSFIYNLYSLSGNQIKNRYMLCLAGNRSIMNFFKFFNKSNRKKIASVIVIILIVAMILMFLPGN